MSKNIFLSSYFCKITNFENLQIEELKKTLINSLLTCSIVNNFNNENNKIYFNSKINLKNKSKKNTIKYKLNDNILKKKQIFLYFIQKNIKNHFVLFNNCKNKTITFYSKNQLNEHEWESIYVTFLNIHTLINNNYNLTLIFKINHINYKNNILNVMNSFSDEEKNEIFRNFKIILIKPNFFYINLQYRRIKAVKKSRKKLLYKLLKK